MFFSGEKPVGWTLVFKREKVLRVVIGRSLLCRKEKLVTWNFAGIL